MLDYQSFMCHKCGRAVLRTGGARYCPYCGSKLPELKEEPKIVCPMCHGTGKVDARAVQPFNPTSPYFGVVTNAEQKDE